MNRLITRTAALALLGTAGLAGAEEAAAPAGILAPENFTGSVAFTTDYRFRGISNSDGFAVSGGLNWGYEGFSLGIWGSNTEFSDNNVEIDIFGGYGWSWGGIDLHTNLLYYMYPGEKSRASEGLDPPGFDPALGLGATPFPEPDPAVFRNTAGAVQPYSGQQPDIDASYFEVNFGVSKSFEGTVAPTFGLDYNFSPDFFGEDGNAHHVQFTFGASLPWDSALSFKTGYQEVEGDEFSAYFATPDGYDWYWFSVGVSKEVLGFVLDVTYHWVDKGDACGGRSDPLCAWNGGFETFYNNYAYSAEGNTSYRDLARDEVVFTISRSF